MEQVDKLCPFCGKDPDRNTEDHHIFDQYDCPCGASGPFKYSVTEPDADWNTRPLEDALNIRIAELEAELAKTQEVGAYLTDAKFCRARSMGGGIFMIFSRHDDLSECLRGCASRKEELQTAVQFFAIVIPTGQLGIEE